MDENRLVIERRAKLRKLRISTEIAFPNSFIPDTHAADLQVTYKDSNKNFLERTNHRVKIAGRIMLRRIMGKTSFITLEDSSDRIQIYLNHDTLGNYLYTNSRNWDIGDIIAVQGTVFKTNQGELSVRAVYAGLLTKSLRPLPNKFCGLTNQELRYRQRYVDLIVTERTRRIFEIRSKSINSIRCYMLKNSFLEVETPILHSIPGGATAKPFKTYCNALDTQMFLRVSPELYLKRLIVGNLERVFEIGRNFRNEGISSRHNPEFTMMEFYAAYTHYSWIMDYTEELIRNTAIELHGTDILEYRKEKLDFSKPFERLTIEQALLKHYPDCDKKQIRNVDFVQNELKKLEYPDSSSSGTLGEELSILHLKLFEAKVETQIWDPTFIIDYPTKKSPLARSSDTKPDISERFELFIAGKEIANGFSELNDPEEQSERFQVQAESKSVNGEEFMYYDADYIRALEYGMPPAGGCGIGIDRLVMLFTNSHNIRDVILFPNLRCGG